MRSIESSSCHSAFPLIAGSLVVGSLVAGLLGEQLLQLRVDEVDILWISARTACEMAPDRRDRNELCIRHVVDLELAVLRRKVEISLTGHDERLGLDRPKRRLEVALVNFVIADI